MRASIRTAVVAAGLAGALAPADSQAATRIFHHRGGDIYAVAPNGAKEQRVVRDAQYPAISRDGRRLAYIAKGDVWVATPTGAKAGRLRVPGEQSFPAWSPSGNRLVFASEDGIEAMRRDGSKRRRLTEAPTPEADSQPDWSPDGSEIVFTRAGTTDDSFDVLAVGAAGGRTRPIVASPCAELNPRWSPSGDRVALFVGFGVTQCREDITPGVHVVDADGTGDRLVAPETGETGLDWSPDGARIVAGTYFEDLVHFASSGGGSALVNGTEDAYSPAWGVAR